MIGIRPRISRFRRRVGFVIATFMVGAALSPVGVAVAGSPPQISVGTASAPVTSWPVTCDGSQYARTFYVDINAHGASDTNPGTESKPWKTFVHAGTAARSGDRVFVKAGVYDQGDIEIDYGGTCFAAYPGQERQPIIRGAGLSSYGNSNLVITGFTFEHTPGHAIRVVGPNAENIVITNNHTYDTYKSGISIRGVTGHADPGSYDNMRNALVAGNLIELGTNGGSGEIISVGSGAVNVDVAYNEVRIGDPTFTGGDEGIAFKEGVRDSRIYGNVIHDLSDKAIIVDGGSSDYDPLVTNIEIFDNTFYNIPSNGMWVTTEGQGDVDGVRIYNNIVYNTDGNGILVYEHPDGAAAGGTVRNILIEHNTVWNNGDHSGYGGIRIDHPSAPGVIIRDNIAWGNNGFDIQGDNGTTIDGHNLCREGSLCNVTTNPRFVDPPADFGLQTGSPAIGAASDGTDLGALDSAIPPPPIVDPTDVLRVSGPNRYATAADLHRFAWPAGWEGTRVYVATGADYADALAAGAIAGHEGASLLLVGRDAVPSETWDELRRIGPDAITVVGGLAAVSAAVETRLREITPNVTRISGANRYATAAALSRSAYDGTTTRVYVATGENFPDALAAVPSAALTGAPILLTRRDALPGETAAELRHLSPTEIIVLGGTGAVSNTVAAELGKFGATVSRLSGSDRFATAAAITAAVMDESLHPGTWVFVTSGENFPDALAAGPIASLDRPHFENGPILLVRRDGIPSATWTALHAIGPDHIVVVGGTVAVSAAVEEQLRSTDW